MKQLYTIFFIILLTPLFAQPANDDPCGAISLTVYTSCTLVSSTTTGATTTTGVPTPSCGTPGKDTWYSFVAPSSGSLNIKTTAGGITDGVMTLYGGASCSSLTEVACNDDLGASNMPAIISSGLTAGATYYIRFWKKGSGAGTFNICLFDAAATGTSTNTDCSGALQICSTSTFDDNSDGDGATNDLNASNRGCLADNEHQSAWYYWQVETGGTLTFTINPTVSSDDYDFGIWGPSSLCPAVTPSRCSYSAVDGNTGLNTTAMDMSEDAGGDKWVKQLTVTAGEFYILCVDNFLSSSNGFSLSFGGTATINCDPVVLPVVLTSFTATAGPVSNTIQWITASEHNSNYFSLERSADGIHFSEIGRLKAAGNSTGQIVYTFSDEAPLSGVNYYRLAQVDLNGVSVYAASISVSNTLTNSLSIFPNPCSGFINVQGTVMEVHGDASIRIFTAYGQPVYESMLRDAGFFTEKITLPAKGIYWVMLQTGETRQIEKVTY